MVDEIIGGGSDPHNDDPLRPKNLKSKEQEPGQKRQTAVAIKNRQNVSDDGTALSTPQITAAGYGKLAEQIMALAFENDIRVREDKDLAELLAHLDLDSPIPSEALEAIAEILSYVYRANGQPNPFDAALKDAMSEDDKQNKD
jgi:flagellar biosynthesis protein